MTIHYVQEGFIPGVDVLELELSQFVIQVMTILTVCGILAVMGQYFKQPSVIFAIIGGNAPFVYSCSLFNLYVYVRYARIC